MTETMTVQIKLRGFVYLDGDQWVAVCPSLCVATQADAEQEARAGLSEAVELWLESCIERGTLEAALVSLGWTKTGAPTQAAKPQKETAEEFLLHLMVPAYQAAAFAECRI